MQQKPDLDIDELLLQEEAAAGHRLHEEQEKSDVDELTLAWAAERNSPELLPYKTFLMDRVRRRVEDGIEHLAESSTTLSTFTSVIMQTDIERVKFLVRSYLRARLAKIDEFLEYIAHTPAYQARLSAQEQTYAEKHYSLLTRHYNHSFMRDLPYSLHKLDDSTGGISMIDGPNLNKAIFCKVLRGKGEQVEVGSDILTLDENNIYLVRYSAIRHFLSNGDIQLL